MQLAAARRCGTAARAGRLGPALLLAALAAGPAAAAAATVGAAASCLGTTAGAGILGLDAEAVPAAAAAAPFTPGQRERALRSFDVVWATLRDEYWDPKLRGLDWVAVRDSLRPRVETARSLEEARAPMRALLALLGRSHLALIPGSALPNLSGGGGGLIDAGSGGGPAGSLAAAQTAEAGGRGEDAGGGPSEGEAGVELRVLDGRAIAVAVTSGSPAAALGVRPGWELLSAAGQELAPLIDSLCRQLAGRSDRDFRLAMAVGARLQGDMGDSVATRWRDGAAREVRLGLPLAAPEGARAVLGALPPFYVRVAWRRLPSGPGYVSLNGFFHPVYVMTEFSAAIRQLRDAPGLILDLRGNRGGLGNMALGLAGWLVARTGQSLGTMITRGGQLNYAIIPRPFTYDGPLAVLVDGLTASTAEILAAGLQGIGRARVFGTRSAGAALPALTAELPDGDVLLYAVADYVSARGESIDGVGIRPDEEVALTRASLLAGRDAVVDAAEAWITQAGGADRGERR